MGMADFGMRQFAVGDKVVYNNGWEANGDRMHPMTVAAVSQHYVLAEEGGVGFRPAGQLIQIHHTEGGIVWYDADAFIKYVAPQKPKTYVIEVEALDVAEAKRKFRAGNITPRVKE